MKPKFAAITTVGGILLLTMCSSVSAMATIRANANNTPTSTAPVYYKTTSVIDHILEIKVKQTDLEREAELAKQAQEAEEARKARIAKNTKILKAAIKDTKSHIDKTWYVFSGSTPSGWDCSGLVMWTYQNVGIELYHSATAQMNSGEIVTTPKYGDIVAFKWNGSSNAYHVGIYVGPDKMIHSGGKKGDKTEFRSISDFASNHSEVSYTRIIDTN